MNIIYIIKEESDEAEERRRREEDYRKKVLDSFFEYGVLKSIPAQRKKERICLEEMVKSFKLGRRYSEAEVNEILLDFNEDYCTIRRDMIGEGIMERKDGIYIRKV